MCILLNTDTNIATNSVLNFVYMSTITNLTTVRKFEVIKTTLTLSEISQVAGQRLNPYLTKLT